MPFELPYGSFLNYSPRGRNDTSTRSKSIGLTIKVDGSGPFAPEPMIEFAVRRLKEELSTSAASLRGLFGADVLAIPIPPRRLIPADGLWVPKRIADALALQGLVGAVRPILRRTRPIPKSALAEPGQRPPLESHLDSLESTETEGLTAERLLLVDDFVTKGTTLFACGLKLKEAFPRAELSAFALLRTHGLVLEIERIVEPCSGRIYWDTARDEPRREP